MDATVRRKRAAALLGHYLGGALLPPHVPGDPASLVVALRGSVTAWQLLDELGALYGVASWDGPTFRRHVLEDAFPAWKAGARLVSAGDSLVVATPDCPFKEAVALDPRICGHCKAAQVALVEQAVDGVRASVPATFVDGLRACLLSIQVEEGDAPHGGRPVDSRRRNPGTGSSGPA